MKAVLSRLFMYFVLKFLYENKENSQFVSIFAKIYNYTFMRMKIYTVLSSSDSVRMSVIFVEYCFVWVF